MGTFHRFLYRLVVYTEYNLYTFSRCFYFFYAAMPKGVRHHGECRPRRRRRRKRGASRLLLDSKRDVRVCVCTLNRARYPVKRAESRRPCAKCQCAPHNTLDSYMRLSFSSPFHIQTLPPTSLPPFDIIYEFLFSSSSEQPVVYYNYTHTHLLECGVL